MNLIGISINHKTSPIEMREALHLNKQEIESYIPQIKNDVLSEGFILSTCNRTELFGFPKTPDIRPEDLQESLLNFKPVKGFSNQNYTSYFSCSAVKHIFSVATGIDSLIIGDSQILGQMKEAFQISEDIHFSGPVLKRVFNNTIRVGRRAIKETYIGEGAVSVSYAAAQIVEKIFSNLSRKKALVIGAGETGALAAVHLRDKGIGSIAITNRTKEKADVLAKKVNGEVILYEDFTNDLAQFDVLISATSSDSHILNYSDVEKAMKKRKGNPICLMDIAIPRDIDSAVQNIDNVFYNDIDSLNIIVDQNLEKRKTEIPKIEKIILEELVNFFSWYNSLEIVPVIKSLRQFFENIKDDELKKIHPKVTNEDYIKIEEMSKRMIGRLLHNPTINLRKFSENGLGLNEVTNSTFALMKLFKLNTKENLE